MADKEETKEDALTKNGMQTENSQNEKEKEICEKNGDNIQAENIQTENKNGKNNKKEKEKEKEESPKEEPIIVPETYEKLSEAFVDLTKKHRDLEKELKKAKEANNRLIKEYEALNEKYYLLGAEMHNKEKVLNKQLEIKTKNFQRQVLSQFFPIVESLQSALNIKSKFESIDNPALKNFISGIENIHKNIVSIYENNDVREIPIEIGKTKFNVVQHEVVYQHITPDYDDDVIIQVSQRGYMIGNDVLRPAKVTVAKNADKEKEREKKAEEMRKKREEQRKKEQEERERQRKEEEERKKKEEEERKKKKEEEQKKNGQDEQTKEKSESEQDKKVEEQKSSNSGDKTNSTIETSGNNIQSSSSDPNKNGSAC